MKIGIITPNRDVSILKNTLKQTLPNVEIFEYPNLKKKAEIEVLILWKQPKGMLYDFPNLKLICSLGAGVDHIFNDESLPKEILITRIVDEDLTISMRKYILMCVLNFQKNISQIFEANRLKIWRNNFAIEQTLKIGVLGLGALGKDIATHLQKTGFHVFGYSFSKKEIPNIQCFSKAENELDLFLNSVNVLVCLLPLTKETKGILNWELFQKLPKNSYLVNVGRGAHLVDSDLIKAIDEEIIKEAYLDVFNEEPLSEGHPFWEYKEVIITPHIASITNQENAAKQIAENCKNLMEKKPLINGVDLEKRY